MNGFRWSVIRRWGVVFAAAACLVTPARSPVRAQASAGQTETSAGQTRSRASVEELPVAVARDEHQIRVAGGNSRARVEVRSYANELRADFRRVLFKVRPGGDLEDRSQWAIPIRIDLWGHVSDVVKGDYLRTDVEIRPDVTFLIRISAKLHDDFEEADFRRELLRALVIEQTLAPYAKDPNALPGDEVVAPAWLVHGFDQLLVHRREGRPSSFYEGILESGQMLEPAEIFAEEAPSDLDPVSYAVFRASAAAMVEALLDQPKGDQSLRGLLADMADPSSPDMDGLMRQHFPGLRETEEGIEKWWALQLATLGQQQSFEFLSPEETESTLDEVLTVRFEGGEGEAAADGGSSSRSKLLSFLGGGKRDESKSAEPFRGRLKEFPEFLDRPGVEKKLDVCFNGLQRLKRSGFPLYRPVFTRYERVLEKLAEGETKNLAAEFEEIESIRARISDTLARAEDYLNYFEATRSPQRSDAFDDYREMRKELEEAEPPKREDRISRHLDALEREFR